MEDLRRRRKEKTPLLLYSVENIKGVKWERRVCAYGARRGLLYSFTPWKISKELRRKGGFAPTASNYEQLILAKRSVS